MICESLSTGFLWGFAEKLASGEPDEMAVAIHDVGSAGDFDGGEVMANGEGELPGEEAGIWRDDSSAENVVGFV